MLAIGSISKRKKNGKRAQRRPRDGFNLFFTARPFRLLARSRGAPPFRRRRAPLKKRRFYSVFHALYQKYRAEFTLLLQAPPLLI